MRVISKSGEYDIPYELSVFWTDENIIWANAFGTGKIIVAQYSSMEKAEKAMQKLHNCYQEWAEGVVFHFPSEDEIR